MLYTMGYQLLFAAHTDAVNTYFHYGVGSVRDVARSLGCVGMASRVDEFNGTHNGHSITVRQITYNTMEEDISVRISAVYGYPGTKLDMDFIAEL